MRGKQAIANHRERMFEPLCAADLRWQIAEQLQADQPVQGAPQRVRDMTGLAVDEQHAVGPDAAPSIASHTSIPRSCAYIASSLTRAMLT